MILGCCEVEHSSCISVVVSYSLYSNYRLMASDFDFLINLDFIIKFNY